MVISEAKQQSQTLTVYRGTVMAKAHHGGADSRQRTTDSTTYHSIRHRWCPSCRMHTKSHGLHVHMLLYSNSLYHHMPCNDTRNNSWYLLPENKEVYLFTSISLNKNPDSVCWLWPLLHFPEVKDTYIGNPLGFRWWQTVPIKFHFPIEQIRMKKGFD